jgi:hypothetical protein
VSIEDSLFTPCGDPKTRISTGFLMQTNDLIERIPKIPAKPPIFNYMPTLINIAGFTFLDPQNQTVQPRSTCAK